MKRLVTLWTLVLLSTLILMQVAPETAGARKLKVYSLPKEIAPGEMGIVIFENPDPTQPKSQSNCVGEKLVGWVKSDIPILRIEQNGKQVWMPLISYQTVGDSSIATFMAPTSLEAGHAQLFLINDHDFSVPYGFTVTKELKTRLIGTTPASELKPFGKIHVLADGLVPEGSINPKKSIDELEMNIGYSKLSKADQWNALNRRVLKDWDNFPRGNFLMLEQGGKKWKMYADGCGVDLKGMTVDYTLPPDIAPGPATISITQRLGGANVLQTPQVQINITADGGPVGAVTPPAK
jgi:hypothetical protein